MFVANSVVIPARRASLPVLEFETRFVWTILLSDVSAFVADVAAVVADVDADEADPDALVADVAAFVALVEASEAFVVAVFAEVEADDALDPAALSEAAALVAEVAAAAALTAASTDPMSISKMSPLVLEKTMSSIRQAELPPLKSAAVLYAVRSATTAPVASTAASSSLTKAVFAGAVMFSEDQSSQVLLIGLFPELTFLYLTENATVADEDSKAPSSSYQRATIIQSSSSM